MGVHGLWKLLEPAGKPVPLESLENKVLAVDVSIWLYQLTKGLQTTGGGVVPNAHILGLFNRICKLLYYRIKPVFVFDGGVPLLKKETIEARKRQKLRAKDTSEKLREKLLDNLLKQRAVNQLLGSDETVAVTSSRPTEDDLFALPPLPEKDEDDIDDDDSEDEETELSSAKLDSFCQYQYGKDVHSIDITSEQFKSLPADIRHDILSELQETRKQNSWARIHEMPEESTDFSKFQMARLMKRRNVQRSLESAAKEMGGRMMTMSELEQIFRDDGIVTDSLPGKRIAGDSVTRYVYVSGKNSEKDKPIEKQKYESSESAEKTIVHKKVVNSAEAEETRFRKTIHEIDQCVFAVDSSSDEEAETLDSKESEYANTLSREENISQEEIMKLIKQQNATSKKSNERQSTRDSSAKRPFSNLSEDEDDPDIVESSQEISPFKIACSSSTFSSEWNSRSDSSQRSAGSTSETMVYDVSNEENYEKSLSKLDEKINSVGHNVSEPCCSKTLEDKSDAQSVELFSDSDSEDLIEVTDTEVKSQYFEDSKQDATLEISINPANIADDEDIFADVFASEEKHSDVTAAEERKSEFEIEKTRTSSLDVDREKKDSSETIENQLKFQSEIKKVSAEDVKVLPTSEQAIREDKSKKDNVTDSKTANRIKKVAEIFKKVSQHKKNSIEQESKDSKKEKIPSIPPVHDEKLTEVQRILNTEQTELLSEQGKQERLGSTITQQMIIEAQELLQLFGLPYVIAPMEAEAQCAFLDQIKLTEGTITDDSDIWLFGGQKVYKNFFDNRKYVLLFRDVDIEHFFRLSREQLIQMALLVGSDYAVGIEGIGPVTAMEILAYFSDKNNRPETEADIADTLQRFRVWVKKNRDSNSVLARKVKNVKLSEEFPNTSVIEAYLYPTVNESKEGFTWATPDLDRIREYMRTKFGWKMHRIDEILLPVMKRLSERNKQATLDAFFKARPHTAINSANMSKRVIQAINIMKNKTDVDVSQLPTKSPRKSNKKGSNKMPKQTRLTNLFVSPQKSNTIAEVIPQQEKAKLEAAKRKMAAVKLLRAKRKNTKTTKKQKTLQPKKDSSYLSESSSEGD